MAVDYTDQGIDPESGLTLKQREFVDHYLTHLNAAKAYRDAGYVSDTYANARKRAAELLDHPDVSWYVRQRIEERRVRLAVAADRVLMELAVIAYARVSDYRINPNTGAVEVNPGVPIEALGAVRSVEHNRPTHQEADQPDGTKAVRLVWSGRLTFHDKPKAIDLLCRHLGLVSAELPPLEVLLNRLPRHVADVLRQLLAAPPGARPPAPPIAAGTEAKP